ncbi:MAG TPA: NADPH-dependent F420 reductase [Nitrospira sp.]|nr:NADPH-dependent F420 reductase [Nitrospira sp.]
MKIGIIGAGNVGVGLAKFWVKNGHEILLSYSRDMAKLETEARSLGNGTRTGSPSEAASFGDVVVLSVPWTATLDAVRAAGPLRGKLVLSTVNALLPDMSGMAVGTTTSAAEEIAKLAPEARVVEALPSFAELLHSGSTVLEGQQGTIFYCGDDRDAKQLVASLIAETGVEAIDAGPLRNARFIEPAMMLLVQLAYPLGMDPVASRLLRNK